MQNLNDLLRQLSNLSFCIPHSPFAISCWQVQRIGGSANNLLYRATSDQADVAIKFTIRDWRRRATREYLALQALQQAGLDIAPQPIWLDETSYFQPVVVQTWLDGVVSADPPQTDLEWELLIAHYTTIHTITLEKVAVKLETAVINFNSLTSAWEAIQTQLTFIPADYLPSPLQTLLSQLQLLTTQPLTTIACSPALCRVDANTLNFLRRPDNWASVDWENSGWGDPAFEIVDIMTHPKFEMVSAERWEWVMTLYGKLTGDKTAVSRIRTYYSFMLVWWAARLARTLYEVPRGLDERLVERPSNWQTDLEMKYQKYVKLAQQVIG